MNRRKFLQFLGIGAASAPVVAKSIEKEIVKPQIPKLETINDTSDIIYNISPQETPFISKQKKAYVEVWATACAFPSYEEIDIAGWKDE